ncbi:hypothetical protein [Vulcanisaeta sp. JCM 16159]|uniref:hypothetical protein n=1 Tax=Vulcanisaeta sp. JCM 16159 TaxID=1295371 RepID=UPI000AE97CA8|nr:hypothetical protein [Vulcanisaeta sp. JCM 16159]
MDGDSLLGGLGCLVDGVRLLFRDGSWVLSFCGVEEVVEGSMLNRRSRGLGIYTSIGWFQGLGSWVR